MTNAPMRSYVLWLLSAAVACPACRSLGDPGPTPPIAGASEPIPDPPLANAIQQVIGHDPVLRSEPIRVSVTRGEVRLAGTVPNVAAKWRASQVVATFKGASSLKNDIVVKTPVIEDGELARSVDERIEGNRATRRANVKVTSSNGTVTIRGVADSESQREILAEIASRVPGVRELDLEVELPAASRGALATTAEVRARLDDDARLDGARIAVAAHGETVALSGVVGSLFQHDAAVADAMVAGVANVDAYALRVDWIDNEQIRAADHRPPPSDATIADAVRRRLLNDGRLGTVLPSVTVDRGVVTLEGPVTDIAAEKAADWDAYRVRGVRKVDDRMAASANVQSDPEGVPGWVSVEDVRGDGSSARSEVVPPKMVEDRTKENIFWDPRIRAGQITVAVAPDGDVTLTGMVDSWGQVRAAEADAVVAGATHVTNRLRLSVASGR